MKKKTPAQAEDNIATEPCQSSIQKHWCALLGFRLDNHDEVGCLALRTADELRANPRAGVYKIVDDISDAKWFPCENYDNLSGFATPEKWLEFFSDEPALKEWKFHLVKRTSKDCG